jgi:hypothetical protein
MRTKLFTFADIGSQTVQGVSLIRRFACKVLPVAALSAFALFTVGNDAFGQLVYDPGKITTTTASDSATTVGGFRAAFGVDTGSATLAVDNTLTITGANDAPATLTLNSAAVADGSVFAFRGIGTAFPGLTELNVKDLTFTGGNRQETAGVAGAFGGGALFSGFAAGQTINITGSTFDANAVIDARTGGGTGAGGGGLFLNSDGLTTGLTANLDKVTITNNTAEAAAASDTTASGAGLQIDSYETISINNSTISGNTATSNDAVKAAVGGGIAIYNHSATVSEVNISNTTISNNVATSAAGEAVGGGLWLQDTTAGFKTTLTNVTFENNQTIGATGASGGAVWTDSDLTIEADSSTGTGATLFSGNTANGVSRSITSQSDVTFDAVNAGDTITDNDGFDVTGAVTVTGAGTFVIEGEVSRAGSLVIDGGTVNFGETAVAAGKSAMVVTNTVAIENGGTAVINWDGVDMAGGGNAGGFANTADFITFGDVNVTVDGGTVQFNYDGSLTTPTTYFYIDKDVINVGANGATVDVNGDFQVRGRTVTGTGDIIKTGIGTLLFGTTTGENQLTDGFLVSGTVTVEEGTLAFGDRNAHAYPAAVAATYSEAGQIVVDGADAVLDIQRAALVSITGANADYTDVIVTHGGTLKLDSTDPTDTGIVKNNDLAQKVKMTVDGGKIESYRTDGSTAPIALHHGGDHIDTLVRGNVGVEVDEGVTFVTGELTDGTGTANAGTATITKTGAGTYKTVTDANLAKSTVNVEEGEFVFDQAVIAETVNVDSAVTFNAANNTPTTGVGFLNANSGSQVNVNNQAAQKFGQFNIASGATYNGNADGLGKSNLNVNNANVRGIVTGVHDLNVADGGSLSSRVDGDQSNIQADSLNFGTGTYWFLDLANADLRALVNTGLQGIDGYGNVPNTLDALERGGSITNQFADYYIDNDRLKIRGKRYADGLVSDMTAAAAYLHRWNTIYRGATDHIDSYFRPLGLSGEGYLGQSPCVFGGHSVWANYVGRSNRLNSTFHASDIKSQSNGVQTGFDFLTGRGLVIGAIFGYEDLRSRVAADSVDGDDYYFGLYGAKMFASGFDIRGAVGYGHQKYDMKRWGATVLGPQYFNTSPTGHTVEANLELGRRFTAGPIFSFRPVIGLDFLDNEIGSAYEGSGGLAYGKTNLQQLFIRVGTDAQWTFNRLNLNLSASFAEQLLDDRAEASVTGGLFTTTLRTQKYGNSVFTFGAGANYALNASGTWLLFSNYNADIFADSKASAGHTFTLGTQWKF